MKKDDPSHRVHIPIFILFFFIFFIAFSYVILRAYFIGFTHDESLTFTILNGERDWVLTANNHWLNTTLSYVSFKILGSSEFALRLPNVLAFLVYGYFCYKLVVENSKHLFASLISIAFFILNPVILEFFSLSRGYGLAIAFCCGCFYYFSVSLHLERESNASIIKGIICSILTIYANYAFVIPVIAVHFAYIIMRWRSKRLKCNNKFFVVALTAEVLLLLPALNNIVTLQDKLQLYFGGVKGFIYDTYYTVFNLSFKYEFVSHQKTIFILFTCAAIFLGVMLRSKDGMPNLYFVILILTISCLLTVLLHYAIGIKFPKGRAALYWINILGLFIYYFLVAISEKNFAASLIFHLFFLGYSVLLLIGLSGEINLRYSNHWKGDADIRSMLNILKSETGSAQKPCNLMVSSYFEPAINYYRISKNLEWLEPVSRNIKNDVRYDYIYAVNTHNFKMENKKIIKDFPLSKSVLLKILRQDGCCPEAL